MNDYRLKWLWGRIKCLHGYHRFDRSLIRVHELEVLECGSCKTHANLHHGFQQCFISRRHSMYENLVELDKDMKQYEAAMQRQTGE